MNLLVLRFSAMGDVALTAPVLKSVLQQYPEVKITLLTNQFFKSFFSESDRLNVVGVNFKNYKGLKGLIKLASEIKKLDRFDAIIDLHGVLRSFVICHLVPAKTFRIDKGRKEKKAFTQKSFDKKTVLKHTTERYADVFAAAGLPVNLVRSPSLQPTNLAKSDLQNFYRENNITQGLKIGVAPFAKHFTKMWPLEKMRELLQLIDDQMNAQVFLIGGSKEEIIELESLAKDSPKRTNAAGCLSFPTELALIADMDAMISMDSGNMHLAALSGTKSLSIWGGTHPHTGFAPFYANKARMLQNNDLACRPCSIFGKPKCPEQHFNCMKSIEPNQVFNELRQLLAE